MKKTLLFLLVSCWSVIMMAGNVTPEEALQQATKFMKERVAKGVRRAPASASSLTMAKDVCGLYVVNVGQSDGFIIVSPDDRTEAILGYSDNGTLDPDNMPENMRAWLQGYADEIKWLNEHNYQPSAKARRVSPVKPAIDPLMKSHWNQGEPYNNLCPYYKWTGSAYTYNTTGGEGYEHCVTGCVATAMAQAMYYNKWPTAATAAIPEYTWNGDNNYGALSSTTFDWANMKDNYPATGTAEEIAAANSAVATLMQYCGHSLQMNYGPSSSASTASVPDALKTFFDYPSTVKYVGRGDYTYANWIELMYDELTKGRVVIYRGKSTGGGHAFICDGYQGEDYFHINWGWGGSSDDYFKLSVVDPDEQGIGGSSSDDGFWMGQGAVVGIQKNAETVPVLDVPTITASLTLNSVSAEKSSMTTNETIKITFNITNNSTTEAYENEIAIFIKGTPNKVGNIKTFRIPANATKDCVIDFSPSSAGTYSITACRPTGVGYTSINYSLATDVTVTAGTPDPINPTSDDITLGRSIVVENSENTSGANYNIYGSIFKGVLTVTNPEVSTDYKGYYQCDLYLVDGGYNLVFRTVNNITVPAAGSINIPIEYSGMINGKKYEVDVIYYKNGTWGAWDVVAYFTNKAAAVAYAVDGTTAVTKLIGTSFVTPSTSVAVDLSGTGVTTVTKNSNPNCLYILKNTDAVPSGLTNVVTTDGSAYTAANITLTDGNDFYTPVDFTATNIEFTYNNDRWANGTNGWNTIMLPFDVTSVTANGTAIDWFHSGSDAGKQFWLKQFIGDDTTSPKVSFDYVSGGMKANTPYIIALPGTSSNWDDSNSLQGKTIKFIGSGEIKKSGAPAVVTASNYRFVGNTKAVSTKNIYCINAAGNQFELKATGGSAAFRPFFKPEIFDRSVESLSIGGVNGTTAIQNIKVGSDSNVYFDLNGRRVLNPTKGVYIKNGNKVVIK